MSGILLPGDAIAADTSASVLLGPGFTPSLHATVAGLHAASSDGEAEQRHLLLSSAKRYAAPALHDPVIACVVSRSGDSYIMDINGVRTATLGVLDFPGATKRNKPELVAGDYVLARIEATHPALPPVLSCPVAPYGPLPDIDYVLCVGLYTARLLLLRTEHAVYKRLEDLGVSWTSVVGVNGLVGISGKDTRMVVHVLREIDGIFPSLHIAGQEAEEEPEIENWDARVTKCVDRAIRRWKKKAAPPQ
ncbi:MAG: hypothetical protein SGCHY_004802 [Lobulomycetales sp.]